MKLRKHLVNTQQWVNLSLLMFKYLKWYKAINFSPWILFMWDDLSDIIWNKRDAITHVSPHVQILPPIYFSYSFSNSDLYRLTTMISIHFTNYFIFVQRGPFVEITTSIVSLNNFDKMRWLVERKISIPVLIRLILRE